MNTRTLGRTGLAVSELALGGLFLASWFANPDQSTATVRRAVELGVNFIDTAPGYGNSEEALGHALAALGDAAAPLILSTKLGGRPQSFNPQDKAALFASVEESLRLLGRDQIDLLMIHEPDRPGQHDWWSDWEHFTGPVLEVLDELKRAGVIRFTGLGGTTAYTLPHIIATGRFDVVLTAFNYSLLWREAEIAVLPAAQAQGMGIVIGSPLQQGALARRYDDQVHDGARWLSPPRRKQFQALYAFLDEAGLPIAEVGLRFVISNPDISCTLMGARSAEEVELNVAAVEKGPLPADILARLDEIAAMVPFRPFEEPFGLPFARTYKGPGVAR
jgi:aryl-alcohol dehydrogenase-like predicted oxidoreductase